MDGESSTTLVIFGASGDLTSRLLLPALAQLLAHEPDRRVHLAGADLAELDDDTWRGIVRKSFSEESADDESGARRALDAVADTTYHRVDITDPDALSGLLNELKTDGRVALYFAVPPAIAAKSVAALAHVDLPQGTVLALEKPFGTDLASARELNRQLAGLLPEQQIFRVDHFLGQSTTLNLLGLRFANRLLEPVWSASDVEKVEIVYDEALGLEGRAGYYDTNGAMLDMLQSHLLQVLSVVAMDPPATLSERDLRDARGAVLRATRIWHDDPAAFTRRARYTAGSIDGRQLPDYTSEEGVDASRETETLAEMVVEVRNGRWAGVPFLLRSGKAIGASRKEIVLHFRHVAHLPEGFVGHPGPSLLRFSFAPDVMTLSINVNGGADPLELHGVDLDAELGTGMGKAYAEVIGAILDGDASLAVRGDAAEECWRIVESVQAAWRAGMVPLQEYAAGSNGPQGTIEA